MCSYCFWYTIIVCYCFWFSSDLYTWYGTPLLRRVERSLWYTIACLYPVTRVGGNRVSGQTHALYDWWHSPQSSPLLLLLLIPSLSLVLRYSYWNYWYYWFWNCFVHVVCFGCERFRNEFSKVLLCSVYIFSIDIYTCMWYFLNIFKTVFGRHAWGALECSPSLGLTPVCFCLCFFSFSR